MRNVTLDDNEWNQVMAVLSTGAWNVVNPLLMKIGSQLAVQRQGPFPNPPNLAEHASGMLDGAAIDPNAKDRVQ